MDRKRVPLARYLACFRLGGSSTNLVGYGARIKKTRRLCVQYAWATGSFTSEKTTGFLESQP